MNDTYIKRGSGSSDVCRVAPLQKHKSFEDELECSDDENFIEPAELTPSQIIKNQLDEMNITSSPKICNNNESSGSDSDDENPFINEMRQTKKKHHIKSFIEQMHDDKVDNINGSMIHHSLKAQHKKNTKYESKKSSCCCIL